MMPPVRCFSCGKPVADKQEEFDQRTRPPAEGGKGEPAEKVLNDLELDRYCCRRMLLGYSNLIDEVLPYPRF